MTRRRTRPLRLAFSGSAGTGKTTLALRLAKDLDLVYVEEGMRRRLNDGLDIHAQTSAEHAALIGELWEEQMTVEREHLAAGRGVIADRSPLDYAAFWLHYDLHHDRGATERFFERAAEEARGYDRILLTPWGVLELEADGVRSTNRWSQLRYQALVEGVLERWAGPEQVLRVPATTDFEQRVAAVRSELDRAPGPRADGSRSTGTCRGAP